MKKRIVHVWQEAEKDEIALLLKYYKCGYELASHSLYYDNNKKLMISFILHRECDHNCELCKSPKIEDENT